MSDEGCDNHQSQEAQTVSEVLNAMSPEERTAFLVHYTYFAVMALFARRAGTGSEHKEKAQEEKKQEEKKTVEIKMTKREFDGILDGLKVGKSRDPGSRFNFFFLGVYDGFELWVKWSIVAVFKCVNEYVATSLESYCHHLLKYEKKWIPMREAKIAEKLQVPAEAEKDFDIYLSARESFCPEDEEDIVVYGDVMSFITTNAVVAAMLATNVCTRLTTEEVKLFYGKAGDDDASLVAVVMGDQTDNNNQINNNNQANNNNQTNNNNQINSNQINDQINSNQINNSQPNSKRTDNDMTD